MFDLGSEALLHPGWRCQKQPCTNSAILCRGNTRSGVPGRFRRWSRKRRPSACATFLTRISADVFFEPILDISQDRLSGVKRSISLFLCRPDSSLNSKVSTHSRSTAHRRPNIVSGGNPAGSHHKIVQLKLGMLLGLIHRERTGHLAVSFTAKCEYRSFSQD